MKKLLAVLLAFAMLFAFAACGGNEEPETTTAPVVDEATDAPATDAPAIEDPSVADPSVADPSVVDPSAVDPSAPAAAMPEGTEAIVAYFNTAINNAKANSKSIKSNYMVHAVAGEVTGVPKIIDTVLGGTGDFIGGFMGADDSKANVTWTSAADKNKFFPVEGETWASKLTAADVKNAKVEEKDGKWVITITTIADGKSANVKHGNGHAPKAFNVVLPAVVDDNIPGAVAKIFNIGTTQMNYPSSTVVGTVDPATGNVIHANYMLHWTINLALGDNTVVLPFSTENDYNINW